MIRAVHVVSTLAQGFGGPTRSVRGLCENLVSKQSDVEIVALDIRGFGPMLYPRDERVRTSLVPCRYFPRARVAWSPRSRDVLRASCRRMTPCVVHNHGLWLQINHAAAAVAWALKLPHVIAPRGMLMKWAWRHRAWKKRIAWALYQRRDVKQACVLHATSRQEAADLRGLGLRQPIAIIPNGVDLPKWREQPRERSGPRKALFLGRIHPVKGLLNLVRAWSVLRPRDWEVIIAGPDGGGHQAFVEEAVRAAGLQDAFSFVGPVHGEAKWDLYRQCDLFVLPTHSENFSLVVAEALACGLPTITTVGAPWAELREKRCGWWVEIGAEPLAEALREAMALTAGERAAMGRLGRQLIEERYTWPVIAAKTRRLYDWLLGQGPRPEEVVS